MEIYAFSNDINTCLQSKNGKFYLKWELQCQNKLISSEQSVQILQNEIKIIKIGQAILEMFNFKDRDLDKFARRTTEKPKF